MRVLALAAWTLLVGLGCEDEKPGLALHISLSPPSVVPQVARLVVVIESPDGILPMRDVTGSGVQVHADGTAATLTFASTSFNIRSAFDVLLVPTGTRTFSVNLSGVMYQEDMQPLGAAPTVMGITIAPGRRTSASLGFVCGYSNCMAVDGGAPAGTIDLAMPPSAPKVVQIAGANDNDQLVPLAVGHFSASKRGDLVMATPGRNVVYVFHGMDWSTPGFPTSYTSANADLRIFGQPGESLGTAAAVGDFNNDGIDDLVVTSAPTGGPGVVYVISGTKLSDPSGMLLLSDPAMLAATVRVLGNGTDRLGAQVLLARVRTQTFADLIVSAPGAPGATGQPRAGRVYVVFGTAASPPLVVQTGDPPPSGLGQQNATFYGPSSDGNFGLSLAAGDLDGAPGAEVVIGAYADAGKGTVFVVRADRIKQGGARFDFAATPPQYDLRAVGTANSKFGFAVAVADVDGTQGNELIVGARDESKVFLFNPGGTDPQGPIHGSGTLDTALGQYVLEIDGPVAPMTLFGTALATGNLDSDAAADLIIGAPGVNGFDGTRLVSGAAYVVRGSSVGALGTTPRTILVSDPGVLQIFGAATNDQLGGHVGVGNFDVSDLTDEIIVGAQFGGTSAQGVVYAIEDLP